MKWVKLIVVAVIVMAMTGCGGGSPATGEVKRLIVNTEVISERLAELRGGEIELKIKNQYTRTENGVTVFYYDFKLVMNNFGGVGSGTIRIEKAGEYWKSEILGWSKY